MTDPSPSTATASVPSPARRRSPLAVGLAVVVIFSLLVGLAAPAVYRFVTFRTTHSLTDDAFIEGTLIHIAPQLVTGRLVRFPVEENDEVAAGEVIARIIPASAGPLDALISSGRVAPADVRGPAPRPAIPMSGLDAGALLQRMRDEERY